VEFSPIFANVADIEHSDAASARDAGSKQMATSAIASATTDETLISFSRSTLQIAPSHRAPMRKHLSDGGSLTLCGETASEMGQTMSSRCCLPTSALPQKAATGGSTGQVCWGHKQTSARGVELRQAALGWLNRALSGLIVLQDVPRRFDVEPGVLVLQTIETA
jgi:hypothetical protein